MVKKTIFLIILLYFLVLLQNSFFVSLGFSFNFVLLAIFLFNFFLPLSLWQGLVVSFLGGLFLDIFSLSPIWFFGFYVLVALALSLFIQLVLKKHVQFSIPKVI